jgi:hypothetical protein
MYKKIKKSVCKFMTGILCKRMKIEDGKDGRQGTRIN